MRRGADEVRDVQNIADILVDPSVSPDLHGALYAETYGREEPVAKLVPATLIAFLESDRAFARSRVKS